MNQEILEKSLQYYNFIQAKKKQDIIDGINWANLKEAVIIPKFVPTKVEKKRAGWLVFFKEMFKNLRI